MIDKKTAGNFFRNYNFDVIVSILVYVVLIILI